MREWVFKSYRPVDPYEALLDQARTILTFLTGRERDFGTEEQDQEQDSGGDPTGVTGVVSMAERQIALSTR